MATIDVSKIEGYEAMTAEEKLTVLQAYEFPDPDYSGYVKKDLYDKTASDLAKLKKEHSALLSDDERQKKASEDELTALREKVEVMEKEKLIAGHKAQFLALGYDEALASETAQAMADGDSTKVFANQKKFLERHDKAYKATLMGATSIPPAGNSGIGRPDYAKLIENAQGRGDFAEVAYYTRLSEQEKNT